MKLYELCGADRDVRFSPFVWRTRLAIAHKGLPCERVPTRFLEKDGYAASGSKTVPVLEDNGHWVADSWAIACYLEDSYPDHPALFAGAMGRAQARFINRWADMVVLGALFPMIAIDVWRQLDDVNQPYFRETREKRLGRPLEDAAADRDARRDAFQATLTPLAATLKDQPFLSGDAPAHADYLVAGPFAWAHVVSDFDPLDGLTAITDWRARLFDLFDGMVASAPRGG